MPFFGKLKLKSKTNPSGRKQEQEAPQNPPPKPQQTPPQPDRLIVSPPKTSRELREWLLEQRIQRQAEECNTNGEIGSGSGSGSDSISSIAATTFPPIDHSPLTASTPSTSLSLLSPIILHGSRPHTHPHPDFDPPPSGSLCPPLSRVQEDRPSMWCPTYPRVYHQLSNILWNQGLEGRVSVGLFSVQGPGPPEEPVPNGIALEPTKPNIPNGASCVVGPGTSRSIPSPLHPDEATTAPIPAIVLVCLMYERDIGK